MTFAGRFAREFLRKVATWNHQWPLTFDGLLPVFKGL